MDWLDISAPIDGALPTFEGDPAVHIERAKALARGDICNLTRIDMGAHTGTHIDAPVHFIEGAPASESIPLEALLGPAWVVDARDQRGSISASDVARFDLPAGERRLLFRTANSGLWREPGFRTSFVGFDESAARALVERRPLVVGIDYLSVAPFGDPAPTHRTLLAAGIVVLEGLDLGAVEPGPYELICLPLRIVGSDGAPARALLRARR